MEDFPRIRGCFCCEISCHAWKTRNIERKAMLKFTSFVSMTYDSVEKVRATLLAL